MAAIIIQLLIDPKLHPELVALLEALPLRSRATKIRMMLEAQLSGEKQAAPRLPVEPSARQQMREGMPPDFSGTGTPINALDPKVQLPRAETGTHYSELDALSM